ncbi:hypothetical protein KCU78_g8179, partial [Aureobasidium melanogenum]
MDSSVPSPPVTNPLKRKAPADDSLDQQTLQTLVFDTIIARLKALNIPTYHLDQHKLSFALPTSPSDDWLVLLDKPILLSDDAFANIIACTETTGVMKDCPKGHTVYYIRSIKVEIRQLRAILNLWRERGTDYPEATIWESMVEDITDDSTVVYIRYLGKTNSTSGQERHRDDEKIRDSRMFSDFCRDCKALWPSVMASVRIFHVDAFELKPSVYGAAYVAKPSIEDADLRERVLIALVGQASSLNRQSGGTLAVYQPSDSDIAAFKSLNTSAFAKLAQDSNHQKPSATLRRCVTEWMDKTLHFAAQNSAELGLGDKNPLNHQHRKEWIDQALPTRLFGHTLMITMGDDIPLHILKNPMNFWLSKARSAQMMKDFFSRLMAYEQGRSDWHPLRLDPFVEAGLLPFIDHCYWPNMKTLQMETIALTRSYIATTKPLLALVLGFKCNKVVRANFLGPYHPSIPNLLSELRNFTIQYHTDPGETTTLKRKTLTGAQPVNPEDAFIQIPSFHPGADKYGSGSTAFRRIIDINFWKVWLAVDVTLDVLYRFENDASLRLSRLEVCRLILEHVERRWQASGAEVVFQQAKQDLDAHNKVQTAGKGRWKSDDTRAFTRSINGRIINVTNQGKISFYWKNNTGQDQRIVLSASTSIVAAKEEEDKTRRVFFTYEGIDIQDKDGNSMSSSNFGTVNTKPTIPRSVLEKKLSKGVEKDTKAVIELWEHETGLNFADSSVTGFRSACGPCKQSHEACLGDTPCNRCKERNITCFDHVKTSPVKKRGKEAQTTFSTDNTTLASLVDGETAQKVSSSFSSTADSQETSSTRSTDNTAQTISEVLADLVSSKHTPPTRSTDSTVQTISKVLADLVAKSH